LQRKKTPAKVHKPVPIAKIERIDSKVDIELDETRIATVSQYLVTTIQNGIPSVLYPEVMATIHLWEDNPTDRSTFEKNPGTSFKKIK
jgi:hypothetical protein